MTAPTARPALALALYGPTASGKSALALALARQVQGEIVNGDSLQLYAGLPVLTACPTAADYAQAPHHLYEVLDPAHAASAGRYRDLAEPVLTEIAAAGRVPIVTGGTGLYLEALLRGLSPLPPADPALRHQLGVEYDLWGAAAFHARLAREDPESAARLAAGDRQRLIRAREVVALTGRPLSAWQAQPRQGPVPGLTFAVIVLLPPRDWLYRRCEARLDQMLLAGAVEEVARLDARDDLPATASVWKAVGVPQLRAQLQGRLAPEDAAAEARAATRQFAKRQWTWARHRLLEADLGGAVTTRLVVEAAVTDADAVAAAVLEMLPRGADGPPRG